MCPCAYLQLEPVDPWLRLPTRVDAFECLKKEHLIGSKGSYQFHQSGNTHLHSQESRTVIWELLAFFWLSAEALKQSDTNRESSSFLSGCPKLSLTNTTNGQGLAESRFAFFHERSLTKETTTQTHSVSVTISYVCTRKTALKPHNFKDKSGDIMHLFY